MNTQESWHNSDQNGWHINIKCNDSEFVRYSKTFNRILNALNSSRNFWFPLVWNSERTQKNYVFHQEITCTLITLSTRRICTIAKLITKILPRQTISRCLFFILNQIINVYPRKKKEEIIQLYPLINCLFIESLFYVKPNQLSYFFFSFEVFRFTTLCSTCFPFCGNIVLRHALNLVSKFIKRYE